MQPTIDVCPAEAVDHMPCEDPRRNSQLSREMNFYRERHCPVPVVTPLCLIPPPAGYWIPVPWPESLHKIWHSNMPHIKIAERKGHPGWMKEEDPYFIFPGGGTMFPDGAVSYIEKLGQYIPLSGGVLRTAVDMGCGVASFGGYLLKEDILTLSFAPRDSHKSQIQFALERGIPAFVAMLGTRRLPFPAYSFDMVPSHIHLYNLSVLKLDGSSFDIQISGAATVAELKQAVEDAFTQSPREDQREISWSHVWGHFCLCFEGQKLINKKDYIQSFEIQDGCQLYFIRHLSINYDLMKRPSRKGIPAAKQHTTTLEGSDRSEEDKLCKGVVAGDVRLKGRSSYFPSPMKVFRQQSKTATKVLLERSPLCRG